MLFRDVRADSAFQRRLDRWQESRDSRDFTMSLQIDPRSDTGMGDLFHLLDAIHRQRNVHGVDVNEPSRRFAQNAVEIASRTQRHGVEGIPHITCRRDHISIASEIIGAVAHSSLRKVIVMSGDSPNQHLRRMLGRYRRLEELGITRRVKKALGDEAEEILGLMQHALHNPDGDVIQLLYLLDAVRRGEYMGKRQMEMVRFAIGVVFDHTLGGLALKREQDRLRAKREARANSVWGQPVFTKGQMYSLLESMEGIWDRAVLPGIWPLDSRQKAIRLNQVVPGVEVPQEVIEQLLDESEPKEQRLAVGRQLARKLLDEIVQERLCAGAYLVAPLREPWDTLKMLNGQ